MRFSKSAFPRIVCGLLVLAIFALAAHSQAFGASESILWSFGTAANGGAPLGGLISDTAGNLYGTTFSGGTNDLLPDGTVFELTPPSTSGGNWSESVLWSFNGTDGSEPVAGLIMDKGGNLYGTTTEGGAHASEGTVFELTPPSTSGGGWTESILWSFGVTATDGRYPFGGLISDSAGNLYGTTQQGGVHNVGTVFKLIPPSTSGGNWAESILWSFAGIGIDGAAPEAGLIMDSSGNLYGTTVEGGAYGEGTAFELTTAGNESVLWSFGNGTDGSAPYAGLTMDASGNLYGTTWTGGIYSNPNVGSGGTVFKLTTAGNESVLWSFGNGTDGALPYAGLLMDAAGNLYGTTWSGGTGGLRNDAGTVFELTRPSTGGGNWSESILWNFAVNGADGFQPYPGLIMDRSGNLYGTTQAGGTQDTDSGTVFEISTTSQTPTPTPSGSPTPSMSPTSTPSTPTPTGTPTPPPLTPTPTPTPLPPGPTALTVSPKTLAFGTVNYAFAGSNTRIKRLTITNPTKYKTAAIIVSIMGPAGFAVDPSCNNVALPAGGKLNCDITYTPTGLGPVSGTLVITDNADNSPQIVGVSGTGTQGKLYTTPGALNFGKVAVNTSAAKTLTLKNRSASIFTISSISNTNPVFAASQNCLGTIAGDGNCSITVTYTPTDTIKSTDTLTIVDTPDGITRNVPLAGTGK